MLYLASLLIFSGAFGLEPKTLKLPARNEEMQQNPKCMEIHWRWMMLRNSAICHTYSSSLCVCIDYHEIEGYEHSKTSCAQMGGNLAVADSRDKLDWLAIWLYETMSNLLQVPAVNKTDQIQKDRFYSIKNAVGYEAYVALEWLQSKWSWTRGSTVTEAKHLYWHPFKLAHNYHKYGTIFITRVDTCFSIVFCNSNEFGKEDEVQLGHSTANDGVSAYICEIETNQEQTIEEVSGIPCDIIEEMWLRQYKYNIAGGDFIIPYCSYYSSGETCYCLNEYSSYSDAPHEFDFHHLKTWQYSSDICRFMGGHLATIDTVEKREWMAKQHIKPGTPTVIGLEKVGSEWHWHTSNGTRPAQDIPWSMIQPGDFPYANAVTYTEHPYMTFTKSQGAAKDLNRYFWCEFEKSSAPEPTTTMAPITTTTTAVDAGLLTCDQIYSKWKDHHHHSSSGYTNPLKCGVVDGTCYCRNLVVLKGNYENNWLFAKDQCLQFGGRLAKLDTEHKLQQVANWLGQYLDFYIGLRKEKGVWTWIDDTVAQDIKWHKAAEKSNQSYYAVLTVGYNPPPSAISLTHYDTPNYICEHVDYRDRVISKHLTCSEMENLWSKLHKFNDPKCSTFNNKCYCSNSVYRPDFSISQFEIGNNSCYEMNGMLARIDNENIITWLHAWQGEVVLFTGLQKKDSLWVWNDGQVATTVPWRDGNPKDLPGHNYANLVMKQPVKSLVILEIEQPLERGFISASSLSLGDAYLCEHDEFKNDAWVYLSEEFERGDTKDKTCEEIEKVWKKREEQLSLVSKNRTGDSSCSSLGDQCFCINRIHDIDLTSTIDAWEYSDEACKFMGADLAKLDPLETIDWLGTWMRLDIYNISVYIGATKENNEWIWTIDDSKVNIEMQGLLDENKHAYIYIPSKWEAEAKIELRSNNGHFEDCRDTFYNGKPVDTWLFYCANYFFYDRIYEDNHMWYYMCQYFVQE